MYLAVDISLFGRRPLARVVVAAGHHIEAAGAGAAAEAAGLCLGEHLAEQAVLVLAAAAAGDDYADFVGDRVQMVTLHMVVRHH